MPTGHSNAPKSTLGVTPTTVTANDLRAYQDSLNRQYGYVDRNTGVAYPTACRFGEKRWVRQAIAQPANNFKFVYSGFFL